MWLAGLGWVGILLGAAIFAASVLVCVLAGGALAGAVAFGALELRYRPRIQQRALESDISGLRRYDGPPLEYLMEARYRAPFVRREPRISAYLKRVGRRGLDGLPDLLNIDPETLYRLHYRQICGLMQVVATSEAQSGDRFTPLTDTLIFSAESRALGPGPHWREPDESYPSDQPVSRGRKRADTREDREAAAAQRDLDLALREIDRLQAVLGQRVAEATFPYMLAGLAVALVPLMVSLAGNVAHGLDAGLLNAILAALVYLFGLIIAIAVGLLLALGAAVLGTLVIGWLDRALVLK